MLFRIVKLEIVKCMQQLINTSITKATYVRL